ncbi:MAG TPA: hypothetical protein VHV55_09555 [Pirellulales bacterium]|jgi:hypothetical protein|nr:hypothetical protein [Pirellulales bacterium]
MKLVSQMVRDGFDVTVAFWVKTREEGLWFLYIASNDVDTTMNLGESYRRLYLSLSKISDSPIPLAKVKLINSSNPIAQAAIKLRDLAVGGMPVRAGFERLGSLAIDELYIYPRLGPMTPAEVVQAVAGLLSRQGPVHQSQVNLHNGSTVVGVPCAIRTVGSSVQIDLLESSGTSRSIGLTEISSIQ